MDTQEIKVCKKCNKSSKDVPNPDRFALYSGYCLECYREIIQELSKEDLSGSSAELAKKLSKIDIGI
ncbi:MAG: hypothetical protein SVW57_13795 [Thermodesulfobacteriota bacterium]|nr:hypothetical protein [Thermodesulfobacteriota bacterium]